MTTDRDPNANVTSRYDRDLHNDRIDTFTYVVSGLIVALGLLAFLFYDGGSSDAGTTGSVTVPQKQTVPALPGLAPIEPAPAKPAKPASPTPAPMAQ